jgi:hypothetical protein
MSLGLLSVITGQRPSDLSRTSSPRERAATRVRVVAATAVDGCGRFWRHGSARGSDRCCRPNRGSYSCVMTRLVEGRADFAAQSWGEAYRKLADADDETALELDDLEQLALAAFLCGHDGVATDAWTRAHHEASRRGDPQRAARAGISILSGLIFRGDVPPGVGWLTRVARVLSDRDRCAEHAWIDIWSAFPQMFGGDPTGAEPTFVKAVEEGERFGDVDLVTMARVGVGMCRVMRGLSTDGVALLDEAMVAVTAGEVSPMYSGIVYCSVIAACSQIFDVRRASQWTMELARWCDSQPDLVPFRGNC